MRERKREDAVEHSDELKIVEAIPFLRRKPGMFFRSGEPNTAELIDRLESHVRSGDWGPLEVAQYGDLIVVRTAGDWMETGLPVGELFERLHSTPHLGANTVRPEVFVAAFSRAWGTRGKAGAASGAPDPDVARALSEVEPKWGRVLVWKPL